MSALVSPCSAPAASTSFDWLQLGLSLQELAPERAASCFADAARADPHSHAAALHGGLLALVDPAASAAAAVTAAAAQLSASARIAMAEANVSAVSYALRALGDAKISLGDWERAAAAYIDALALAPRDCAASAGLANARSGVGEHAEAATVLRAALAEDHACPPAHHGLARLLVHLGDVKGALRHVHAALELRPFDASYEATLRALRDLDGGEADASNRLQGPDASAADASAAAAAASASAAASAASGRDPEACGAPAGWASPPVPADLAAPDGRCPSPSSTARGVLLLNPFEEGCFHDDMRAQVREASTPPFHRPSMTVHDLPLTSRMLPRRHARADRWRAALRFC